MSSHFCAAPTKQVSHLDRDGLTGVVLMTSGCRWHNAYALSPRCPTDALRGYRHHGKEYLVVIHPYGFTIDMDIIYILGSQIFGSPPVEFCCPREGAKLHRKKKSFSLNRAVVVMSKTRSAKVILHQQYPRGALPIFGRLRNSC